MKWKEMGRQTQPDETDGEHERRRLR